MSYPCHRAAAQRACCADIAHHFLLPTGCLHGCTFTCTYYLVQFLFLPLLQTILDTIDCSNSASSRPFPALYYPTLSEARSKNLIPSPSPHPIPSSLRVALPIEARSLPRPRPAKQSTWPLRTLLPTPITSYCHSVPVLAHRRPCTVTAILCPTPHLA